MIPLIALVIFLVDEATEFRVSFDYFCHFNSQYVVNLVSRRMNSSHMYI